ncbi:MAG: hypothetical protein ABI348_00570 [Nitrososphaera sp.]
MVAAMYCKGMCVRIGEKMRRIGKEKSPYMMGQKRCTTCEIYITTDGRRCPCCNLMLKTGPTDRRLRDKLRLKRELAGASGAAA